MSYYRQHIFFCTNRKADGRKCCNDAEAKEICAYAKSRLKAAGLAGKNGVRVSSSGCMGRCSVGPALVIYPEQVWYTYKSEADIDEILVSHIENGQTVNRLLLSG